MAGYDSSFCENSHRAYIMPPNRMSAISSDISTLLALFSCHGHPSPTRGLPPRLEGEHRRPIDVAAGVQAGRGFGQVAAEVEQVGCGMGQAHVTQLK